jgi:hypothetical protein
MSAGADAMFRRAGRIIGQSRIAALVDRVSRICLASVRSSRFVAAVQQYVATWQTIPAAERASCALVVVATAVAGHLLMASMLPTAARPTLMLTALVLLAVCLAAGAHATRRP